MSRYRCLHRYHCVCLAFSGFPNDLLSQKRHTHPYSQLPYRFILRYSVQDLHLIPLFSRTRMRVFLHSRMIFRCKVRSRICHKSRSYMKLLLSLYLFILSLTSPVCQSHETKVVMNPSGGVLRQCVVCRRIDSFVPFVIVRFAMVPSAPAYFARCVSYRPACGGYRTPARLRRR